MFIDSHAHLYDGQFDADREDVMQRAFDSGVEKVLLPNCDLETVMPMMEMVSHWPKNCFPMMGLHPCYVKENYKQELAEMLVLLDQHQFCAIGEIGLDYHWDLTFAEEQKTAFEIQVNWALERDLPIVIHTRKSIPDGISMIEKKQNGQLKGVFHCFGGTIEEAKTITGLGFYLGIGGVASFKNGGLKELLKEVELEHIILETDAPYLAPVPYRGKRNESAYIPLIAQTIADIKGCSVQEVEERTTRNTTQLFKL